MDWNFRELAGTLRAEMAGHPPSVVIAISSTQEHATISEDGICPTIPAAAGEGGGMIPMVAYEVRDGSNRC